MANLSLQYFTKVQTQLHNTAYHSSVGGSNRIYMFIKLIQKAEEHNCTSNIQHLVDGKLMTSWHLCHSDMSHSMADVTNMLQRQP